MLSCTCTTAWVGPAVSCEMTGVLAVVTPRWGADMLDYRQQPSTDCNVSVYAIVHNDRVIEVKN